MLHAFFGAFRVEVCQDKLYKYSNSTDMEIQSNFNGSNTFGTMKISSRQG